MKSIYLDHSATTPVDKEVLSAMLPYFSEIYGNASSLHSFGQDSKNALDEARDIVAKAFNAESNEIYFTSGGTESDNWALKGYAYANKAKGNHIITTAVEHPAILETCKQLENNGFSITYLPVDNEGFVTAKQVEESITENTILVSVMMVNNEIGNIMPIKEIGELCRSRKIAFHTDAVQACGTIDIDVKDMKIDMMSISSHKIYGPKGVGILFRRRGIKLQNFMSGGEQERGFRAGTTNTPGIVGFAKALEITKRDLAANNAHIKEVRDYFIKKMSENIKGIILNGPKKENFDRRSVNNANYSFKCIEGEAVLLRLDLSGVAVSSGSACSSGSLEPSHVLLATGMPLEQAHSSIRFSFGKNNTLKEVDEVVEKLVEIVESLRKLSPIKMEE